MAGWDVTQLLLLAGDARHLPFRRLRVVTTHAQGVETTVVVNVVVPSPFAWVMLRAASVSVGLVCGVVGVVVVWVRCAFVFACVGVAGSFFVLVVLFVVFLMWCSCVVPMCFALV